MAPSIAYETVETAIARWLARSLAGDVDAAAIYWIRQGNARGGSKINVAPPYITMSLSGPRRVGTDGKRYERDEDEVVTEIVEGPRVLRLELQCFGLDDVKGTRAAAYLETALTCLTLEVNQIAFRAANIAFGPIGEIVTLPQQEEFEPRATVELAVHVISSVSGPADEIKYMELKNTTMGEGVDDVITTWVPEEPPP